MFLAVVVTVFRVGCDVDHDVVWTADSVHLGHVLEEGAVLGIVLGAHRTGVRGLALCVSALV